MKKPLLGVKKLHEDALIPQYAHSTDSGFDLHTIDEGVIEPHGSKMLSTGLAFNIPQGYEIQVRSRSGLAAKQQIQSHFGTVDESYRGEVKVILFNHSDKPFAFKKHDRVAQAVISPIIQAELLVVESLDETERGSNGFGSTGI